MLEYIFENRKYDMALRDVKATLFDIVSAEEAKIASLMDKIYKSNDAEYQAQLVDVCNAQDECLKRVLKIFSELEKTLKKLDSYSRELKHIENDNLNDIIANYKGVVNEQARALEQLNAAGQMQNQMVEQAPEVVQEQAVSQPEISEQYPVEEQEISVTPEQQVGAPVDAPQEEVVAEVPTPEPAQEVVADVPAPEPVQEEVADVPAPEPAPEAVADVPAPEPAQEVVTDAPKEEVEELIPAEETATSAQGDAATPPEDEIIPYDDSISTVVADEVAPKVEEGEATDTATVPEVSNIIIPQPEVTETVVGEESNSQATLISGKDEEKIEGNVAESMLTQLIPTQDTPTAEVPTNEAEVKSEESNASVPLIIPTVESVTAAEDSDAKEENTPIVIPTVNTGNAATDENAIAIPTVVSNEEAGATKSSDNNIIAFKKKDSNAAKVIITSASQTGKLRGSLGNQEAILNGLGFFMSDATLENKLVENGLLPGDAQAKIEQMMNQANALYAEGKVEEAQKMYDEISALNKQTQTESVGIAI